MIRGGLFTRDFLNEGITETAAWAALGDSDLKAARARLAGLFVPFLKRRRPNETETEKDLIWPVLGVLGWAEVSVQQNLSVSGRMDVPDALLFTDEGARARADALEPWQRFRFGACIVEAKRWDRLLDREDPAARGEPGVPSTQMLRYLRRVDDVTEGRLRWGILTNGRHWRLYWQGALSVAEDFFEVDLAKALGLEGFPVDLLDLQAVGASSRAAAEAHALRLFLLVFGRGAFVAGDAGKTFHDLALAEGKFWEQRVARDLSDMVFDKVFPLLVDAIPTADRSRDPALGAEYLEEVRQGALILLYRLLFILYAEDRNLLPDETGPYAEYALTRIRLEVAAGKEAGRTYSAAMATLWPRLSGIFRAIAQGDDVLGIPPYNGGLFDAASAPILDRIHLPDKVMAEVILCLSHQESRDGGRGPRYINYRDLSVQQLGSVYERILEHGIRVNAAGSVEIAVDASARKGSGSYYTPEELVALIIERAVGPLVTGHLEAFRHKAKHLASDHRQKAERRAALEALDPASRMLELKVCDPAMGSGHFLVSLVDWLADRVLEAMAEAAAVVTWTEYASPLSGRIAAIRDTIRGNAQARGWVVREGQLDDRHIVRRMILKRVIHGVDKNPMAVKLAKVALWLHSFTVGAPLSFLDHHLRCGDSVVGAWVLPTLKEIERHGALLRRGLIRQVERSAVLMERIENITDNDVAEVAQSKSSFAQYEAETRPVDAFFSLLTAERILGVFAAAPNKAPPPVDALAKAGKPERVIAKARADAAAFDRAAALQLVLEGSFGDPVRIALGEERVASADLVVQFALLPPDPAVQDSLFPTISPNDRRRVLADGLVAEARAIAGRHRFLHWEIAFPNVWTGLASNTPTGGFDAVIGNPPYVRQELLGELKPALKPEDRPDPEAHPWTRLAPRAGYLAYDGAADLYVYFYEQGLRLLKPGGRMSYVVTNKWLKAGYAEALRGHFADAAWVEFVADFGHAKHFFPDADVFPSVIVVRRPDRDVPAPEGTEICVIPRDEVPEKGLSVAVAQATYPLPRAVFTRESWTLEPPDVMRLLDKIRRKGVPLSEYAGVKPYRGVLTGFNEAFLIDTPTRERLVREDPASEEIIKPYLRGQDIERWHPHWAGLWMIVLKSSGDHAWPWTSATSDANAETIFAKTYPALHRHMKPCEAALRKRQDHGRHWWELRACAYYDLLLEPKICYQEIQYHSAYSCDTESHFGNNKMFLLPARNPYLLAVLNSPLMWWHNWRYLPHMKDEALSPVGFRMEDLPIAFPTSKAWQACEAYVARLVETTRLKQEMQRVVADWLKVEYGIAQPGRTLSSSFTLDTDGFVAAVRAALPKKRGLSAAEIARLRQEYREMVEPAHRAAAEVLRLERALSDLVNAAYGLTREEVRLMWQTAPPRMPLDPAEELARLHEAVTARCAPPSAAWPGPSRARVPIAPVRAVAPAGQVNPPLPAPRSPPPAAGSPPRLGSWRCRPGTSAACRACRRSPPGRAPARPVRSAPAPSRASRPPPAA